jgi:hypothetical protein
LEEVHQKGKRIQIDLKEGGDTMRQVAFLIHSFRIVPEKLWVTTNLKDISLEEYGWLHQQFPEAIFQSAIPLRFMFDLMDREERHLWLQINRDVGVRSLAISWHDEPKPFEIEELREAGFQVNFYHVDTVADFQQAAALKPLAITSDFHIPEWNLFGRGSGENGFYKLKEG